MNQFEVACKFNKNYNRHQDCSDYHVEVKKEILIEFERYRSRVAQLETENAKLLAKMSELKVKYKDKKEAA